MSNVLNREFDSKKVGLGYRMGYRAFCDLRFWVLGFRLEEARGHMRGYGALMQSDDGGVSGVHGSSVGRPNLSLSAAHRSAFLYEVFVRLNNYTYHLQLSDCC